MANFALLLAVVLLAYVCEGVPVSTTASTDDLKVETLQNELSKLQAQLQALKGGRTGSKSDNDVLVGQHPTKDSPNLKPIGQADGVFYDTPVKIQKRLYERRLAWGGPQPLRQIGFPPLRSIQDDPSQLKREQPRLQLTLDDNADIRQDIIAAVENHLLEDLEAAKAYGVQPEEILRDLKQKQQA